MNKAVKYAAIASGVGAGGFLIYKGSKALIETNNPAATIIAPVQPLVTLASGGALQRWTRANGAVPTHLVDKGSPCRWPSPDGATGNSPTRSMIGLYNLFVNMPGVNGNLATCYCALAAHEAGSTASYCFNYNPYGIHWYRTMEPRPGYLATDAGVPTMFLAFTSWLESCEYLHNTLLERSEAYRSAKELGSLGDIEGFTRMLGAGGYATVYSRQTRVLADISSSYIRGGYLPRGNSPMLGG